MISKISTIVIGLLMVLSVGCSSIPTSNCEWSQIDFGNGKKVDVCERPERFHDRPDRQ